MNRTLDTLPGPGCWACCGYCRWLHAAWAAFHPPAYATRFDLLAPLTLENFARAWNAAPFPRYFLNTFPAGHHGAGRAAGAVHVGGLRLRALRVPRPRLRVHAGAAAADGDAGRAAGGELPLDEPAGVRDTVFAVGLPYFALGLRHLPAAPDLQDRAARTGGSGAGRGRQPLAKCS